MRLEPMRDVRLSCRKAGRCAHFARIGSSHITKPIQLR